jgi:hypothetical protein
MGPGFLVKKAENAVTDHKWFLLVSIPANESHMTSANKLALENDSARFGSVREPLDSSPSTSRHRVSAKACTILSPILNHGFEVWFKVLFYLSSLAEA